MIDEIPTYCDPQLHCNPVRRKPLRRGFHGTIEQPCAATLSSSNRPLCGQRCASPPRASQVSGRCPRTDQSTKRLRKTRLRKTRLRSGRCTGSHARPAIGQAFAKFGPDTPIEHTRGRHAFASTLAPRFVVRGVASRRRVSADKFSAAGQLRAAGQLHRCFWDARRCGSSREFLSG